MAEVVLFISMISSISSELSLSEPLLVPAVTCAGMVAIEAWEGMAAGAGVAVVAVGVTSTVLRYEGTCVHSLHRGDGVV